MSVGTPGFIGSRLKEARELAGLSIMSLADLIGVTRQAISLYEGGTSSPSPETMRRISQVLDQPVEFFLLPPRPPKKEKIFFRSRSAATKTARQRASHLDSWLKDILLELAEYVDFPEVNFPGINVPSDPVAIADEDIESIATAVRRFWKLRDGPISNIVRLFENNGAIVARFELGADTLDSFSTWFPEMGGRPCIVLGADKNVAVRSRFDAAHELGHMVLHRNVDDARLNRPEDLKLIEHQAYRFAGAFLLPAPTFAGDVLVPTLNTFETLKPKWQVSIAAMIERAQALNLVSPERATSLWINYSKRRWRKAEPLDDKLEVEEPRLLSRAFDLLISSGRQSRAEIPLSLSRSAARIEAVAGLPSGYFDDDSITSLVSLKDRRAESVS